jgi:pyruvate ferredoxin oxidoreductase gamma subunit
MHSNQQTKMKEFLWYGRGGQGAVTASNVLALSLVKLCSVQSFPEFGPERMGAPVKAFTRISNHPIRLHCAIYDTDSVIVLDPTLLKSEERVEEIYTHLKPEGFVIINSPVKIERSSTYAVDVGKIAEKYFGRKDRVNIPMIGALKKALDKLCQFPEIPFESLETTIYDTFPEDKNPGVAKRNIVALKEVYETMQV